MFWICNAGYPVKSPPDRKPPGQKPPRQKLPDNKLPRIIEEIIAKYAIEANLFPLGSTNPKKKNQAPGFFLLLYQELIVGGLLSA